MCQDEDDWNSHGNWIEEKCFWDFGWFDDECATQGDWGYGWTIYIYLSATAYILLWVLALRQFRRIVRSQKIGSWLRVTKRIFKSPKQFSILWVFIFCFLRTLYTLIDPLSYKEITGRLADRLLYEGALPFLYQIYCWIFLVLCGMYQLVRKRSRDWISCLKRGIYLSMFASFPAALLSGFTKGFRVEEAYWEYVGYFIVLVYIMLLLASFISFALVLFRIIRHGQVSTVGEEADEKVQLKYVVTLNSVQSTENFDVRLRGQRTISMPIGHKPGNIIERIQKEYSAIHKIRSNPNPFPIQRSKSAVLSQPAIEVSPMEIEESIQNYSGNQWSSFSSPQHSEEASGGDEEQLSLMYERKENRKPTLKRYMVVMDKYDRFIVTKMLIMLIGAVIIGTLTTVFGVLYANTRAMQDPKVTLGALYFGVFAEVVGVLLVTQLLQIKLKHQQKDNLNRLYHTLYKLQQNHAKFTVDPPETYRNLYQRMKKIVKYDNH